MINIVPRFSPSRIEPSNDREKTGSEPLLKAKIEWEEKPESHIFRVYLPGFKNHELRVSVNVVEGERRLHIMAERCTETFERHKANVDSWHKVERRTRSLRKSFQLPDDITAEKIEVTRHFDERSGVFTLTIHKGVSKNNVIHVL